MANKGTIFEREIARFITNWISGQSKELYCWRSPGSGSVATINLGNKAISGDLIPLKHEAAPFFDVFSIECKNGYPDTNPLLAIWKPKCDDLRDFWTQCCRDADKSEKLPLLIYKKKGKKILLGLSAQGITRYFHHIPKRVIIIKYDDLVPLHLMELEETFNSNPFWGKNENQC